MATRSLLTLPLVLTLSAAAVAVGSSSAPPPPWRSRRSRCSRSRWRLTRPSRWPESPAACTPPARRLFLSLGIVAGVLAMRLPCRRGGRRGRCDRPRVGGRRGAVSRRGRSPRTSPRSVPPSPPSAPRSSGSSFAEYLFNTDRLSRRSWLGGLEARLARVARPRVWALVTAVAGVLVTTSLVGADDGWAVTTVLPVALGGVAGTGAYLGSKRVAAWSLRGLGGTDTGSSRREAPGASTPTPRRSCSNAGSSSSCCSRSSTACTACPAPGCSA